jgi:hypothetical protein
MKNKYFNLLKPRSATRFSIQKLLILSTEFIYVFCIYLKKTATSAYMQH